MLNYRRSNKGFTPSQTGRSTRKNKFVMGLSLLELLITIAVLSIGIIAVLEAFAFSARSTGLAGDMVNAVFLAEDKIQELEFNSKLAPLAAAEMEGSNDKFAWKYALSLDADLNLYQLTFDITWNRANKQEGLALTTYLK